MTEHSQRFRRTFRWNPVFERELRKAAASPVLRWGLGAGVALLVLVLWVFWPRTGVFSATHGHELFSTFMAVALACICLPAPASAATSVTEERERGTFPLLLTSDLTVVEIGLGKLLASLAAALLPAAAFLPVVTLCALAGGVSALLLMKACLIILSAAAAYSMFGLAVSAMCRSNAAALWGTYAGLLVLAGGVRLPAALSSSGSPLYRMWLRLRAFSPFEAMAALNWAEKYEVVNPAAGAHSELVLRQYLISMAGLSVCAFLVFAVRLLRGGRRRQSAAVTYSDRRQAWRRKLVFPFYLIDPLRRRTPIGRFRNPVAVVELRNRVFGHPRFIVRMLSGCFVGSLWILFLLARQYGGFLDPDHVRLAGVLFQLAVVVFLAPLVAAGSISEERSRGTFVLLRMTLLPAWRITVGKIKAALVYVTVFLAGSLPVLLTLAYLEPRQAWWRVGAWLAVLLLTTLVLISFGLLASSIARTTAAATAAGYAFALALTVVPFGVTLLGPRVSARAAAVVLALDPVAAAMQVCSDRWFSGLPPLFGLPLWRSNVVVLSAMTVVFLVAAGIRIHRLLNRME